MKRQSVEAFLDQTHNSVPFALYGIGDAVGPLEIEAGHLSDEWAWPHAVLHFERDIAVLLADIDQVKQLKTRIGPGCQFIESLTEMIFRQAGVPEAARIDRMFLARSRDMAGRSVSYEQEVAEIERRTSELRDRRTRDIDRRITDMDRRILEMKNRRDILGTGVEVHIIRERRSGADRRSSDDRRTFDAAPTVLMAADRAAQLNRALPSAGTVPAGKPATAPQATTTTTPNRPETPPTGKTPPKTAVPKQDGDPQAG